MSLNTGQKYCVGVLYAKYYREVLLRSTVAKYYA